MLLAMAPSLLDTTKAPQSIEELVRAGLEDVIRIMREELDTPVPEVQRLVNHVEGYRGKMLRPTLALLVALLVDSEFSADSDRYREIVTVGAVVETIHLATLVHDDVLDLATTRRGGPTVNAMDGNELAVILGDYLISKAFEMCSRLPTRGDAPTSTRIGQIASMVCEGEILQLSNRGNYDLREETYRAIIERKTAALIAVAAEQAAVHALAPKHQAWRTDSSELFNIAMDLGAAFQIQDDVLDLAGSQSEVGKPLGVDFALGKLTLPLIHYRDVGGDLETLIGQDQAAVLTALQDSGAISSAHAEARMRVNRAKAKLNSFEDSPAREFLLSIASAVVERSF